jgi:hypothetical protein
VRDEELSKEKRILAIQPELVYPKYFVYERVRRNVKNTLEMLIWGTTISIK